jgi:hypothetical protein
MPSNARWFYSPRSQSAGLRGALECNAIQLVKLFLMCPSLLFYELSIAKPIFHQAEIVKLGQTF